jgi:hypothetical protein
MNRFLAVIAATAAAAAVAAAMTIPAGADQTGESSADAAFVDCLRTHGADIPADTRGVAIKQWLIAHEQDNGVNAALDACNAKTDQAAPEELVSCLRSHGLDVPSENGALKQWMSQHRDDANAQDAFKACDFNPNPRDRAKTGPAPEDLAKCLRSNGADVPASLDASGLKQWIGAHLGSDAVKKCAGAPDKPGCGDGGASAGKPETRPAPEATKTPDRTPTVTVEQ